MVTRYDCWSFCHWTLPLQSPYFYGPLNVLKNKRNKKKNSAPFHWHFHGVEVFIGNKMFRRVSLSDGNDIFMHNKKVSEIPKFTCNPDFDRTFNSTQIIRW